MSDAQLLQDYTNMVLRLESPVEDAVKRLQDPKTVRLLHAAMGCVTEAGEFMDQMKRVIFYGKSLDEINIKEELGDKLWYIALGISVLGSTFIEVLLMNESKLRKRFGDKFNDILALARNLDAERLALETSAQA